jgi:hypothetical protein
MAIDNHFEAAGHDLRHGDEKNANGPGGWGGKNGVYSRCRCVFSLVMGLAG